ncbi:hypothetical protein MBLNU230_g3496t1 [Neophaeotheca triangularis]
MVYGLAYRRPAHVPGSRESLNGNEKQPSINESIVSGSSSMSHGIPDALSFDRIIAGGVCPPCTIRDFMNYLKYIEHSAENLQFFLWYRDYCSRWEQLPRSERVLSPEWTREQAEADSSNSQQRQSRTVNHDAAKALKGTDFAEPGHRGSPGDKTNPFHDPSKTPSLEDMDRRVASSDYGSSAAYGSSAGDNTLSSSLAHKKAADQVFDDAGMTWKPFTTQPYRDEVARIITTYLAEDSPRELNLSGRQRQAVLHALQNTTHPSAFRSAASTVEYSLRRQAHPNFIRWTICNGNRPRVIFARGLGISTILLALVADLLLTLSSANRGYRAIPFIGWFIGIATLIAAWKGMCVVLHGMHHRHMRPWELFSEEPDDVVSEKGGLSQESLNSVSTNSYEDEPWIARYKKRNVVRKVFDREVWIQEPALRQIQDTIFVQSLLGAFVLSAIAVAIFCAVPGGNFY